MIEKISTVIIGGGVVGLAIANELSEHTQEEIVLIERNEKIGSDFRMQSLRSSGVIHAGVYHSRKNEPLKASLTVQGNSAIYAFCEKHNVPYKKTGKLIVASAQHEIEFLEDLLRISQENNIPDTRIIDQTEIHSFEPNVQGQAALYVPSSGIIDSVSYLNKLHQLALNQGTNFLIGTEVENIEALSDGFKIRTRSQSRIEEFECKRIINCAGLYSDDITLMLEKDFPFRINPIRGESAKFYHTARKDIFVNGMNVYPVPVYHDLDGRVVEKSLKEIKELETKGLVKRTVGIHLTPTLESINEQNVISSMVTLGPAKTFGLGKENYGDNLKQPSFYLEGVQKIFPSLRESDIQLHQAGIMAVVKGHGDFISPVSARYPNFYRYVGYDSPALTDSLSIAQNFREAHYRNKHFFKLGIICQD